jgi:MFS family permease
MSGLEYNVALATFFPTYVFAEIPSNMMVKKFGAKLWLTIIMIIWAIIVVAMGFVHNFAGLVAARLFLGLAEGGLFPGVAFYITSWYRRHECGFRLALFFSAATAAGAFGGLLAAAIGKMGNVRGISAWSWIFIIEGLLTLVVAFSVYFVIVNKPQELVFLFTLSSTSHLRRVHKPILIPLVQNFLPKSNARRWSEDSHWTEMVSQRILR